MTHLTCPANGAKVTDEPDQHDTITTRRGSHEKTMRNITEAVRRSIPLRVGLIDVADGQRVDEGRRQLATLGVTEVSTDRLRQVGRGVRDRDAGVSQLCGHCESRPQGRCGRVCSPGGCRWGTFAQHRWPRL
jgi:hypothetical protein